MEVHWRATLCLVLRSLLKSLALLLLSVPTVLLFFDVRLDFARSFSLSLDSSELASCLAEAGER